MNTREIQVHFSARLNVAMLLTVMVDDDGSEVVGAKIKTSRLAPFEVTEALDEDGTERLDAAIAAVIDREDAQLERFEAQR